jgi:hypothetical protein
VIRVYDAAGNEIETHQHAGEFKNGELLLSSHRSSAKPERGEGGGQISKGVLPKSEVLKRK